MGIPVGQFIAKDHSTALQVKRVEAYKGKTASVDGTAVMIALVCTGVKFATDVESYIKSPKFFRDWCSRIIRGYSDAGRVIYCFDGKRDAIKRFEHASRDKTKAATVAISDQAADLLLAEHAALKSIQSKIDARKAKEDAHKSMVALTPTVPDPISAVAAATVATPATATVSKVSEYSERVVPAAPATDEDDVPIEVLELILQQTKQRVIEAGEVSINAEKKTLKHPTAEMKRNALRFLDLAGVPYRQSDGEADPDVAAMVHNGYADFVFATDFDYLAHGCNLLVRNSMDRKNGKPGDLQEFCLTELLRSANIDYEQFVNIALLAGCDYTQDDEIKGVKGMSVVTAYSLVTSPGFEHDLDAIYSAVLKNKRWKPCEGWLEKAKAGKAIFMNRAPIDEPIETEVDIPALHKFLIEQGYEDTKATKMIEELVQAKNTAAQACNKKIIPRVVLAATAQSRKRSRQDADEKEQSVVAEQHKSSKTEEHSSPSTSKIGTKTSPDVSLSVPMIYLPADTSVVVVVATVAEVAVASEAEAQESGM